MGRWMCKHLMDVGHTATVYSRTPSKCQPLVDAGATLVSSPREVAERSDIVFSIVGYPTDVRQVILDEKQGALAGLRIQSNSDTSRVLHRPLLVDMTTSEPFLAIEIAEAARAAGIGALDAPVSGGDVGARNAALSIMVGGDQKDVDAARPMLEVMGKNIRHMGGPGMGQHTKMANQILIATNMIGCVEAMMYSQRAGLDASLVIDAVGQGAAGSWSLNNLCPRMVKRDFEPGFYVEHFLKDLGIALAESRRMGLALPGLALAEQLYLAVQAQGMGRKGTQALLVAMETLNGSMAGGMDRRDGS